MCNNPISGDRERDFWCETSINDYLYHAEQRYHSLKDFAGTFENVFGGANNRDMFVYILSPQDIDLIRDAIKKIEYATLVDISSCALVMFTKKAYKYLNLFDMDNIKALSNLEMAIDYDRWYLFHLKRHFIRYCDEECCLNYDGEICKDKEPYHEVW